MLTLVYRAPREAFDFQAVKTLHGCAMLYGSESKQVEERLMSPCFWAATWAEKPAPMARRIARYRVSTGPD